MKTKTTKSEGPGLYCLRSGNFVKVGRAASDVRRRIETQVRGTPSEVEWWVEFMPDTVDEKMLERIFHHELSLHFRRVRREWWEFPQPHAAIPHFRALADAMVHEQEDMIFNWTSQSHQYWLHAMLPEWTRAGFQK